MMHRKLNSFKNCNVISILVYFVFLMHIFFSFPNVYKKQTFQMLDYFRPTGLLVKEDMMK